MFKNIFLEELRNWLKNPASYFFALVFCAFTFLTFAGSAGFFDPASSTEEVHEWINSPFGINYMLLYLNKLLVVLVPTMVGASIHRDFKYRVHSLLFSFPLNKSAYLGARFTASFCIVLFIVLGVVFSMFLVESLPNLDHGKMGPVVPQAYLYSLLVHLIPNLIFTSAIVIATVIFTRNIYAAFIASLFPFLLQVISENAFAGNNELIALCDPFGQNSLSYYTRSWSVLERNTNPLPIWGLVLYNRIVWLGTGIIVIIISIRAFQLSEHIRPIFNVSSKRQKRTDRRSLDSTFSLSNVRVDYSYLHQGKTLAHLSNDGFKFIIKNPIFIIIMLLGILAMFFALNRVTQTGEMVLFPATKIVLAAPATFYTLISMLLVFIYSGLLVRRERNARLAQLIDVTATPLWVLWGSKFLTMIKIVLLLIFIFMITGVVMQVSQGYYHVEIGLYVYHLVVFIGAPLLIWTAAAFFVHTLVDNFYIGLFILIFGWIGVEGLPQLGLDSYLIRFNSPPPISYSDINGYGISDLAFYFVEGYWSAFAVLLLVASYLLWPYGADQSLMGRLRSAVKRKSPALLSFSGLAILMMLLLGSRIRSEESKQRNLSSRFLNDQFELFEDKFKHLESLRAPKIRSLDAAIDLYPKRQEFVAEGSYLIENPYKKRIDTLLIRTGFDEISSFLLSVDHEVIAQDSLMKFYVVRLDKPLMPAEKLTLSFKIQSKQNTLFERNSNVLQNGTFIKHDIFPRLGYSFTVESNDPSNPNSASTHYHGLDADLIDIHLMIGTSDNQIAIGPGKMIGKSQKMNRNYFEYQTEKPIKFSFGINSGSYSRHRASKTRVSTEIFSRHTENYEIIETSIDNTLRYMEKYFGPYQLSSIRIIEFPDSEGSYSTAFANNIPMSEIRFLSNANQQNNKTNLSYYVPAHELIHHWWGSTMIPASAKGSTMLTESITEYLTLKVYQQQYGKEQADNFLHLQHQRYWDGHNRTTNKEPPLYLVEPGEQYISYGKGTIVFNSLGKLLGEDRLNTILFEFLKKYNQGHPPYPTSIDFILHLKESTPDSLSRFIDDQFTNVAYFENRLAKASVRELDGNHQVRLEISSKKWLVDHAETSKTPRTIPSSGWLQVGFFDKEDEKIDERWIKLGQANVITHFTLSRPPKTVKLDPNFLMLIKDRNNSRVILEVEE